MANEIDELEKFLKLAPDDTTAVVTSNAEITLGNGNTETDAKNSENEEVTNITENALENDTKTEKEEEQPPQTDSESIQKTNGETKIENGDGEKESVTVEES